MKILFYLGHPAQFHFSKNIIKILLEKNHEVIVLIKSKDILEYLVENAGFKYINIQEGDLNTRTKCKIFFDSLKRTGSLLKFAYNWKPDLMIGTDSSIAQSGYILGIKTLTVLEDDISVIKNLANLTFPFSTKIVTPNVCDVGKWKNKKIGYDGYMKLAYLHPKYFTARKEIVQKYLIAESYWLIRVVKLNAHHDFNVNGINALFLNKIINVAREKNIQVFISAEGDLNPDLEKYRLKINHEDIHHVIAFASLIISDSQSMSVESALLGVPSLRFSDFSGKISVLEELEHKYGLTFGFNTNEENLLFEKLQWILSQPNLKDEFRLKLKRLMDDKISVTDFIVNLIETTGSQKHSIDFTLNIYRDLVTTLKQLNYQFLTFEEYMQGKRAEKMIMLRHDVDLKAYCSVNTAVVENDLGIKASYFFRVVPESNQPDKIRMIAELGHEIGYHYEDLSLFKGRTEAAMHHFRSQLEYFRQFYAVKTICMHGSPESKYDNRDVWKSYSYKDEGVIGEPYFDVNFDKVFYLTDTGRMWDGEMYNVRDKVRSNHPHKTRYHTTMDVIRAAQNGTLPNQIMITTHPQRWTNNPVLWVQELMSQTLKNSIKFMLLKMRRNKSL